MICYKWWASCYVWATDQLLLLKEILLSNWSVIFAKREISSYRTDLLQMLKGIEVICYKCWASCCAWATDQLLLLKEEFSAKWNVKSEIWFVHKKYVLVISLSPCWEAEIYDIMFSKKNSFVFRKKVYIHIIHVMLNKNTLLLFLRKTFVTVVEQIDYFCWRRCYFCRKDLLQMLSKLFLMRKRFVTFA